MANFDEREYPFESWIVRETDKTNQNSFDLKLVSAAIGSPNPNEAHKFKGMKGTASGRPLRLQSGLIPTVAHCFLQAVIIVNGKIFHVELDNEKKAHDIIENEFKKDSVAEATKGLVGAMTKTQSAWKAKGIKYTVLDMAKYMPYILQK
jgi:hypothetical protein